MKKRTKVAVWIGAGLVVLTSTALVVGPYLYVGYQSSVVSAPPVLNPTAAASTSTVNVDHLSGTWTVGSGSFAGYRVKEVLVGQTTTVTGRTNTVTGTATVTGVTVTAATVSVDVGSVATTEPARDTYFRDTALQVNQFPKATFTFTNPVAVVRPTPGQPQSVTATGELTLHGVTKTVTVTLNAVLTGHGGQVTGSIPITFDDFGVQAPSLGFVTVENTGSIEFLLNLTQQ
jgi:polyisoprenoid-binding protein YceI